MKININKIVKDTNHATFIKKITNGDFKDRYIILNTSIEDTEKGERTYFRALITQNNEVPTSEEEFNKLEYIKTFVTTWENRFRPLSSKRIELIKDKVKFYPDEWDYLYTYKFNILYYPSKMLKDFEYIGIFDINPPKEEYLPFSIYNYTSFGKYDNIEKEILFYYENYNLKKCILFDKEYNEKMKEFEKQMNEGLKKLDDYYGR